MREISGSFHFKLPADDILDTTGASPQTGKQVTGEGLPEGILDTTGAVPQTGKVNPSADILDTTAASPQVSKTGPGR